MKRGLLQQVRQLLADTADGFFERDGGAASRAETRLAEARAMIRDQLGLLFVEQRQLDREIAAATADLSGLLDKASFAVAADREDLARAALTHRGTLEQRISDMTEARETVRAQITALENAAATLAQQPDEAGIAARLAELDRLLQAEKEG